MTVKMTIMVWIIGSVNQDGPNNTAPLFCGTTCCWVSVSSTAAARGISGIGSSVSSSTGIVVVVCLVVVVVVVVVKAGVSFFSSCSSSATNSGSSSCSFASVSSSVAGCSCFLLFPASFIICIRFNSSISLANIKFPPVVFVIVLDAILQILGNKDSVSPQFAHSLFHSIGVQSSAPIAPSAGVGKKLMSASRINRIPQAGCHNSG
mmetsp:Transcript_29607/g.45360  ORF Transcript_29607/g.45360 Transcript_29607/m.45360 type:complete len:206 (+) Transcript_29607:595-1212(+)